MTMDIIRWLARRRLKAAIRYHYKRRQRIMYARDRVMSQYEYEEQKDTLWHRSYCEYVCAQRLERLLTKYK